MMPAYITAAVKSGRLKELTITQAEPLSRNEQMLQRMREGRQNIKAYWDREQQKVVFGLEEKMKVQWVMDMKETETIRGC